VRSPKSWAKGSIRGLADDHVGRAAQSTNTSNDDINCFGEPFEREPFRAGGLKGSTYLGNAG
jgi:hypothetical protein